MTRAALLRAWPGWRFAGVGALAWSLALTANAAWVFHGWGWQSRDAIEQMLAIVACGALLAFPLAASFARLSVPHRRSQATVAAALITYPVFTIGMTALIYSLITLSRYTDGHEHDFSPGLLVEYAFTIAGAFYQYAVIGTRLYLPFGLPVLGVAAILHLHYAR